MKDDKLADKLGKLLKERRKHEIRVITGDVYSGFSTESRPSNPLIHHQLSEEIELVMKEIGAKNKTALRKEAKGNPLLLARLKRPEVR